MSQKSQSFTLTFKGEIMPDPDHLGRPMTVGTLNDNLAAMINLAIGEGVITRDTGATLDSWDLDIEITEGVAWSDDIGLSAYQLDAKYNPVGDGEHPYFRRKDWRTAVASEDTINSYWGWVVSQIDSYDEAGADPDAKNWVPED